MIVNFTTVGIPEVPVFFITKRDDSSRTFTCCWVSKGLRIAITNDTLYTTLIILRTLGFILTSNHVSSNDTVDTAIIPAIQTTKRSHIVFVLAELVSDYFSA